MCAIPSKSSLKRVVAKSTPGSSKKKPRFSQHHSAEKDHSGPTPSPIPTSVVQPSIFVVDLEVALDSIPSFEECVEDLPSYNTEGSSKEKEKIAPSLLAKEIEVVSHLRSIVSEQDLKSLWLNSTEALSKSTLFYVGRVNFLSFLFYESDPFILPY